MMDAFLEAFREHYIVLPVALLVAIISSVSLLRRVGVFAPLAVAARDAVLWAVAVISSFTQRLFTRLILPLFTWIDLFFSLHFVPLLRSFWSAYAQRIRQGFQFVTFVAGWAIVFKLVLAELRSGPFLEQLGSWNQFGRVMLAQISSGAANRAAAMLFGINRKAPFYQRGREMFLRNLATSAGLHLILQSLVAHGAGSLFPMLLGLTVYQLSQIPKDAPADQGKARLQQIFLRNCIGLLLRCSYGSYFLAYQSGDIEFYFAGSACLFAASLMFFLVETISKRVVFSFVGVMFGAAAIVMFSLVRDSGMASMIKLFAGLESAFTGLYFLFFPNRFLWGVLDRFVQLLNLLLEHVAMPVLEVVFWPLVSFMREIFTYGGRRLAALASFLLDAVLNPSGRLLQRATRLVWQNPLIAFPVSVSVIVIVVFLDPYVHVVSFISTTGLFLIAWITFLPYMLVTGYYLFWSMERASFEIVGALVLHAVLSLALLWIYKPRQETEIKPSSPSNRQTQSTQQLEQANRNVSLPRQGEQLNHTSTIVSTSTEPANPLSQPSFPTIEEREQEHQHESEEEEEEEEDEDEAKSEPKEPTVISTPLPPAPPARVRKRDKVKKWLGLTKK